MSNFLMLADTTTTWLVRMVFPGETYGQWNSDAHDFVLTWEPDKEAHMVNREILVEFFDLECDNFEPYSAQFVSRYPATSLRESKPVGLDLDGGVPKWAISDKGMQSVQRWLRERSAEDLKQYADNPEVHVPIVVASSECAWGGPGMKLFHVFVSREEYSLGGHLDVAVEKAVEIQMEEPLISFCGGELSALTETCSELAPFLDAS